MAAPLGDQSQRALRHQALIVEPAPPTDWRDVAVLVRGRVARQFLADRCPRIGVGAAFEQQTREWLVLPAGVERHHAAEERSVAAEAIRVDSGACIHVAAVVQQPSRDVEVLVIHRHVQERRAGEGRAVQRELLLSVAGEWGG